MLKELLTTFVVSASASGVDVTPHDATQYLDKQATCLAKNMYYEARSQGLAGQLAVSLVVLNRVKDNRYPNTICEVVHQGPVRESWKTRGKNVPESARKYYPIDINDANLVGTVMVKVMNLKNQQHMVHCMTWHLIWFMVILQLLI